jgi:TonB family protein
MFFRPREFASLQLDSTPAPFGHHVFVERPLPWLGFLQSVGCHAVALVALFMAPRILALQPHAAIQPRLAHADVIYYTPSEYLPPLDTRISDPKPARIADPEYSAQPIISVPPEADNRQQTIVAPPKVKLDRDLAIPNMVAFIERMPKTPLPIAPAPVIAASEITRLTPHIEPSVIAPPPDLQATSRSAPQAPKPAVVAPPPMVDANSTHRHGDLSVAASAVIAPAPQLTLDAQQSLAARSLSVRPPHGGSSEVVAPPPSLAGVQSSRSVGDVIALSLHPAVGAPAPAAGNRRGSFTATPAGHNGATGAAGTFAGESAPGNAGTANGNANGSGLSAKTASKLPSGLYVGRPSNAAPVAGDPAAKASTAALVNPSLIAGLRPRVSTRTLWPESKTELSEEERAVFGNRKFYSLTLNMPNLNSVGGSWIIRFAALKPESDSGSPSLRAAPASDQSSAVSDLSAPSAMRKVDPAYPLELMRQNVGGTVILYAVIHADGTVGNVRVLRSVDDRLDQFARDALAKWQFSPATRNGVAVEVEATFRVPFQPGRWQ